MNGKRLLFTITLCLTCALAYAQKDTGIMLDHSEFHSRRFYFYKGANNEWLPEKAWVKKYGRRAFRETYPYKFDYSHIKEKEFIRYNYLHCITIPSVNSVSWSRIFESTAPVSELISRAASLLDNAEIYDNKVTGYLTEQKFEDFTKSYYTIRPALWKAKVTYEFKDNRYKVTLNNIEYYTTLTLSTYWVPEINHYVTIYPLLYDSNGFKHYRYDLIINSMDYSFSNAVYIRDYDAHKNDW